MTEGNRLSAVTQRYLACFYDILESMMNAMTAVKPTDSISADWIAQMMPHHEAGIAMAQNILQYTTQLPLQQMAENMIEAQTQSMAQMKDIADRCAEHTNSPLERELYETWLRQIQQTMYTCMGRASVSNSVNVNFLREMIPHHAGAIQMARNALRFALCPELVPMLQGILIAQTEEIREMERLLCRLERE